MLQPGPKRTSKLHLLPTIRVPELTAFAGMPRVFATAMIVGFFKAGCIDCIAAHLEKGEP